MALMSDPLAELCATDVEVLLMALYTATYPNRAMAEFAARYITEHQNRSRVAYGHLVITEQPTGWMVYDEDATFGGRR